MDKVYQGNQVEIYRVSPTLYFRKATLERDQCNSVFLVGSTGVAVVDVPTPEAAEELQEEAQLLFQKPITAIFLTHGDGDHVGGMPAFFSKDVTIFCSRRLFGMFAPAERGYKATFVAVDGAAQVCLPGGLPVELFTLPDITHSHWDMYVRIPQDKALCTGDAVVEYQTLYFHNASPATWAEQLRTLATRPDLIVLPGHGPIFPYSYVGEVAQFIDAVNRAAKNCFARIGAKEMAGIGVDKVNAVVSAYFADGDADAKEIAQKAGQTDAEREVRMVLWHLIRVEMR